MGRHPYTDAFFAAQTDGSADAAKALLGVVWSYFQPRSVLDFGCGVGVWLETARSLGASDVLGLDGAWVPRDRLAIPSDCFVPIDMEGELPPARDFDLAICVEVLEHVSREAGERAVEWLCRSAPVVLFSAAIPGQGGTNHINEDWLSNWAAVFRRRGFLLYDLVRPRLWSQESLPVWYRQNAAVFATPDFAGRHGFGAPNETFVDVVRPEYLEFYRGKYQRSYNRSLEAHWKRIRAAFRGRRSPCPRTDDHE